MQRAFVVLLVLLNIQSLGQKGRWESFKLLVIQPDTAIVDKSFKSEKDTIEASNLRAYYASLKQIEDLLNSRDSSEEMDSIFKATKAELKNRISLIKAQEEQVKKFKYYQVISQYSAAVYNFYFNEYEPFSSIVEVPKQKTDLRTLKNLANTSKADYIVFYSNIHTIEREALPILKLTTSLYSKRENKIILIKETEGDINSRGDMWTCDMGVMLSCLLINGVRTSTDAVADILRKKQAKNN
jgi:hypothetical protein